MPDSRRSSTKEKESKARRRAERLPLENIEIGVPKPAVDLLAVNDALEKFECLDKAGAELVKLRYYAGLTLIQAADVLGISSSTADRQWAYARAWLHAELKEDDA